MWSTKNETVALSTGPYLSYLLLTSGDGDSPHAAIRVLCCFGKGNQNQTVVASAFFVFVNSWLASKQQAEFKLKHFICSDAIRDAYINRSGLGGI